MKFMYGNPSQNISGVISNYFERFKTFEYASFSSLSEFFNAPYFFTSDISLDQGSMNTLLVSTHSNVNINLLEYSKDKV